MLMYSWNSMSLWRRLSCEFCELEWNPNFWLWYQVDGTVEVVGNFFGSRTKISLLQNQSQWELYLRFSKCCWWFNVICGRKCANKNGQLHCFNSKFYFFKPKLHQHYPQFGIKVKVLVRNIRTRKGGYEYTHYINSKSTTSKHIFTWIQTVTKSPWEEDVSSFRGWSPTRVFVMLERRVAKFCVILKPFLIFIVIFYRKTMVSAKPCKNHKYLGLESCFSLSFLVKNSLFLNIYS